MSYDTAAFIDPTPRVPGFHDAWCRVTWTPRGGDPVTVTGGYLDGDSPNGTVSLGCGIECAVDALGISDLLADSDHIVAVADLVSAQLAERPWATVKCPDGEAWLELVAREYPAEPAWPGT